MDKVITPRAVMNTVADLTRFLQGTLPFGYYARIVFVVKTPTMLKARLYARPNVFVQVYRNDDYDSTNFVLIADGKRLYGRDQVRGEWHRHPQDDPDSHDAGQDGGRGVALSQFLVETNEVLKAAGLLS